MKFLSSKGFSLVEIMIAIGLVGVAGVAVMTLTESSNKEAKWGEMAFVKSEFVSSFGKYITSSRGCDDLRGCRYPEDCSDLSNLTAISENQDIELNWKVAGIEGNPNLEMKKGREFKLFKVSELKIESIDKSGSNTRIGIYEGQKGFVNVKLTLQIKASLNRKDVSAPNRNYSYQFKVPAVIDTNNKILGCFESQSLQESCESVGGTVSSSTGLCEQKGICRIVYSCYDLIPDCISAPPPGLPACNSADCTTQGGSLIYTGGKSVVTYPESNCGGKNPCTASTDCKHMIQTCMVCSAGNTTGGGSTTSGTSGGGTATGSVLTGGTFGGFGGFDSGLGSGSF